MSHATLEPPPDLRRLGGAFDVVEAARRIVRYEALMFETMRLLGGWLARVPEFEIKFELGRHIGADAEHVQALRNRSAELRVPVNADRRLSVELQSLLRAVDEAMTPLGFLVGVYRVIKPRSQRDNLSADRHGPGV